MIVITRSLARSCRAVFKRLLPRGSPRGRQTVVGLLSDAQGLRLRCAPGEALIEFLHPSPGQEAGLALPLEALADCEGHSGDAVVRPLDAGRVEVTWRQGTGSQSRSYANAGLGVPEFPIWPETDTSNGAELLVALDRAMQTAAKEGVRFALHRILLRGRQGDIVATDGRQLLIEGGFTFPWQHDLLLPRVNVFAAPELTGGATVRVALSGGHALFGTGGWTVALKVVEGERFPPVENVIPPSRAAATVWRLGAGEAEALIRVLADLPGNTGECAPVTVDLGKTVTLRAGVEGESRPTEVVLPGSSVQGKAVRWVTDRHLLARACALGFTEFRINDAARPVVCRDSNRLFLWMTLDAKGALLPHPFPVRLSLAGVAQQVSPCPTPPPRRRQTQAVPVSPETVSRTAGASRPGLLSFWSGSWRRLTGLVHDQRRREKRA